MDESSATTTGVLGAILAVVLAVIGFFREWRRDRNDDRKAMKQRIDELQDALNLALEEGRVTDAGRLQKELNEMWEKYRKVGSAKAGAVVAAVSASLLAQGCFTKGPDTEFVVIGERINIVEPGQTVVVPELVPPAKKWYLVDNVGLAGWLGLSTKERE